MKKHKKWYFLYLILAILVVSPLPALAQWTQDGSLIYYNSGKVGIGTATPSATLDVRALNATMALGNIAVPTVTDVNHLFIGAGVFNSQEIPGGEVNFGNNWYYNNGYKYRLADEATNIQLVDGIFKIQTSPSGSANGAITWTDAVTMLTNGNFGIGTATPGSKLDVAGSTRIGTTAAQSLSVGAANPTTTDVFHIFAGGNGVFSGQNTATGEVNFGNNFLYNSGYKYRFTQAASRIGMGDDVTGDINFSTAVSGAAGSAITWSNRMKIQNSTGNIGIGTTSPTQALDVVGNIKLSGGIVSNNDICIGTCE